MQEEIKKAKLIEEMEGGREFWEGEECRRRSRKQS